MPTEDNLSHFDDKGNAQMVDVSQKETTDRKATASCCIRMNKKTIKKITDKNITKGDVLTTAQLAGIMGAKRTSEIIPLCHPLNLSSAKLELKCDLENSKIDITATIKTSGRTGVEMEALNAVSTAALTVYDMCKAVDKNMIIDNIYLKEKTGGKSDRNKAFQ